MSTAHPPRKESADDPALTIERPPTTTLGILSRLGPGLIIAGSIVGSGELIATTKTGAESQFWLLWLIIIGCVIKVFVQVELGRDAITRGKSTMDALAEIPGPSIPGRGNWLVWYWFVMWAAMTAQLGGIAGGVGQAMAMTMPITSEGREFNEYMDTLANKAKDVAIVRHEAVRFGNNPEDDLHVQAKEKELDTLQKGIPTAGYDEKIWTTIIALITAVLLVVGRYGFVQNSTTALVAIFTLVTVGTVIALQNTESWAIGWNDLLNGLKFRLPPDVEGKKALSTALKTFGIIGVGASELIAYPYWCLEKGYARFCGPREGSTAWTDRAKGWLRVLQWDVWCSMIVYTTATISFYLLGAAVLGRTGLNPGGMELIRTLNVMYEPVFGSFAKSMFLVGSFAVLYSTFFVASAGNARICADAVAVIGFADKSHDKFQRRTLWLSGALPIVSLILYFIFGSTSPEQLVLFSGMMQAFMLPMLAVAALYFRYRTCDSRLIPGPFWTAFLWISSLGMLVAAICLAAVEVIGRMKN